MSQPGPLPRGDNGQRTTRHPRGDGLDPGGVMLSFEVAVPLAPFPEGGGAGPDWASGEGGAPPALLAPLQAAPPAGRGELAENYVAAFPGTCGVLPPAVLHVPSVQAGSADGPAHLPGGVSRVWEHRVSRCVSQAGKEATCHLQPRGASSASLRAGPRPRPVTRSPIIERGEGSRSWGGVAHRQLRCRPPWGQRRRKRAEEAAGAAAEAAEAETRPRAPSSTGCSPPWRSGSANSARASRAGARAASKASASKRASVNRADVNRTSDA